jgi:Domain of Unknown Function (DUF928)
MRILIVAGQKMSRLSNLYPISLSIGFTVALTLFTASGSWATAFEPPGSGAPTGTASGGSRSLSAVCRNPNPITKSKATLAPTLLTLRLSESNPTGMQIQVPATNASNLEFSLLDAQHRGLYQMTIPVKKTTVQLPELASKPRYWTIAMVCNESDRTEDLVIQGSMP